MAGNTEEKGITKIKDILNNINVVDTSNITSNDKTISYDGHITIYSNNTFSKEFFIGNIPIQIKSRETNKYKSKNSVSVSDLKIYQKNTGLIYFIIQFKPNNTFRIYYTCLHKFDISKLLKTTNKTSVSVQFYLFPSSKDEIITILKNFIKDEKKQAFDTYNITSLFDFAQKYPNNNLTFNINLPNNFSNDTILSEIIKQQPYIYSKSTVQNLELFIPVDKITPDCKIYQTYTVNKEVKTNIETLYTSYGYKKSSNNSQILLGKNLIITILKEPKQKFCNIKFHFNNQGEIEDRIKALKLLTFIYKNQYIFIGNEKLKFSNQNLNTTLLDELNSRLNFYLDINKLVSKLGIVKPLDLNNLSEQEFVFLQKYCNCELYNTPLYLNTNDFTIGYIKFANISILCHKTIKNNKTYLHSIFNPNELILTTTCNNHEININSYYLLIDSKLQLKDVDNINYDDMKNAFNKKRPTSVELDYMVQLLLKFIKFYDEKKYAETYNFCFWLSNYLFKIKHNDENKLNIMQLKYRNNTLTDEDNAYLIQLKNNTSEIQIKCACSILLKEKTEAQLYLSKLDNCKKIFTSYPIYYLYKQLN